MRLLPSLALIALVPCLISGETLPASSVPPPAASPATNDAALAAIIAELSEALQTLDLPDGVEGDLVQGNLMVTTKQGDDQRMLNEFGVHLRRPNGEILVKGYRKLKPGITVNTKNLRAIPVQDEERADAKETQAKTWLTAQLHPDDHERIPGLIADWRQLSQSPLGRMLEMNRIGLLIAIKSKSPDLPLIARCQSMAALSTWDESQPDRLSLDADRNPWQNYQQRMKELNDHPEQRPRLVDAATGLRLSAIRALIEMAISISDFDDVLQPLDRLRVLEIADHVAEKGSPLASRLAGLRAALSVPAVPAADADLAAQIASWAPDRNGISAMRRRSRNADGDESAPAAPGIEDPAALITLVGDQRPSRWIDQGWMRTIGDNALRILSEALGCDPRLLIKRDPSAPWTNAERTATAADLAAWWKPFAGKPIAEVRQGLIEFMPAQRLAEMLQNTDEAEKASILDRVAVAWKTPLPKITSHELLNLLQASGGHAGLRTALLTWPVTGEQAVVLAVLHAQTGDRAYLDPLIDTALDDSQGKSDPMHMMNSWQTLSLVRSLGTEVQVQKLIAIIAAPIEDDMAAQRWQQIFQSLLWGDYMINATQGGGNKKESRGSLVGAICFAHVLADERPLPDSLKSQLKQMSMMSSMDGDRKDSEPAQDVRFCDLAATSMQMLIMQLGESLGLDPSEIYQDKSQWVFDLSADKATRDGRIAEFRTLLAEKLPPALKDAGITLPIPGAGAGPKGDEKALF